MGGDSKKGGGKNKAADTQARIAEQLVNQTDPLRQALIGRSAAFLGAPSAVAAPAAGVSDKEGGVRSVAQRAASQVPGGTPGYGGPTSGMAMITNSPSFAEFKRQTGANFGRARNDAIARVAPGGALTEALVGLDGQEAAALSQGAGALYEDEINRALSLATGGASQGMSSLGQAGAIQAQMAANRANVTSSKYEGLGAGAGAFMGMK